MAEQAPAVGDILATIERRNWVRLGRLLDPEVHWTTAVEEQLHGPAEVIDRLSRIRRRRRPRTTSCKRAGLCAGSTFPADEATPTALLGVRTASR